MKEKRHNLKRRSISSRRGNVKERPRVEVSAGGLVYKRTQHGLVFAMLKDSFGKWTFPKGHVRRGEEYSEAAEREIGEEMGLYGIELKKPLGTIDIWFRDRFVFKGRLIHKYIHYFLFEAKPEATLTMQSPHHNGERIMDVSWVPIQQVTKQSTYKDMKVIIKNAMQVLESEGLIQAIPVRTSDGRRNRRRRSRRRRTVDDVEMKK